MRVYHWNGCLVLESDTKEEQTFVRKLLELIKNSTFSSFNYGRDPRYTVGPDNTDDISGSKEGSQLRT